MKAQRIVTLAVWCGLCLIQSVMADESAMADSAEALGCVPNEEWPAFEVAVDFCTRQLSYGLVDNRDPIVTLEAAVGWRGFTFGSAMIYDTTEWGRQHGGYGNRKGRYQELAFGPEYGQTFSSEDYSFLFTSVEGFVGYVYEYHPPVRKTRGERNPDTQFAHAGFAFPDLWLKPAVSAELDIDNEVGAIYLAAEGGHAFTLIGAAGGREVDFLSLFVCGGVGFGNAKRNRTDAGFEASAFKDVWLTLALDWHLTDHVCLSPYVAASEQLHRRLREAARTSYAGETHASTQLVGGLRLAASF